MQTDRRTVLSLGAVDFATGALGVSAVLAQDGDEATPGTAPGATSEVETHVVEMTDDLVFDPEELTLRVEETVVWRTVGAQQHTSTCDTERAQNLEEHVHLLEGPSRGTRGW